MQNFRKLLVLLFWVVNSCMVMGQGPTQTALTNRLSILNDRAFFSFPASAENIARGTGIMSHDPNANRETRIIYDIGDHRVVFYATELYRLGDDDLLALLESENSEIEGMQSKILIDKERLQAFVSTPSIYDTTRSAILINSLLVRTPDNTLFRMAAYVNPAGFEALEDYKALSEEVFKTLENGSRTNSIHAHTDTIEIFMADHSFLIDLPENYAVSVDQKYDFQVIRLHKYKKNGQSGPISINIYTGHHPSFFHPEYGFEGYNEKPKGKFLGHQVEWYYFINEQDGLYLQEQVIEPKKLPKGMLVHVAMLAASEPLMQELMGIVQGIRLLK